MRFSGLFAGLTTIDIQYFVEEFPVSNKKIKTDVPKLLVGGPATNAAVAFAYLNGGVNLASATGINSFSTIIKHDFKKNKVQHFNLTGSVSCNPVLALVITSEINGDRNIFTHHPGEIASEYTSAELFQKVNPQIILLDGFYPEITVEIAHNSNRKNIPVILDCGSWKPQYKQLIPLADVAICSEDFFPPGCKNQNSVVDFLHDNGVQKIAISRGEKNVVFCDYGKMGIVPVEKVKVKDSLGAGDFLHGAFCYYYLQNNLQFEEGLKQAVKFATFTCKFNGTRSWINSL